MTTTVKDVVREYCREAQAYFTRGETPSEPALMETVLRRHPEIAIGIETFAGMCIAELRRQADAQFAEADALDRYAQERRAGKP
jgi:hypothetical protein